MSLYSEDYYKGVTKIYFNQILSKIIKFGNLNKEKGLILDFGCGFNYLKKTLKNKNVVGYDIIPKLTDVKDYKNLKPGVIVCNSVLEHLDEEGLRRTLSDFISMNKNVKLITAIPTENFISRIGMILTGYNWAHSDHKLKLKEINKILRETFSLIKRGNVFTMTEVALWGVR